MLRSGLCSRARLQWPVVLGTRNLRSRYLSSFLLGPGARLYPQARQMSAHGKVWG